MAGGDRRSQQLAGGRPSDVARRSWILASADRDRFLKSASEKGWPLTIAFCVSRARARAAPRPAVSIRWRRRGAMGTLRREPIETAGRGVGCGVCALWHFRLGDRALNSWACGRRTARGQSWSPVLADGEARRRFLFWTWRSAVAIVRRPPLAAAGRRAAFGCGWRSGFWHRPTATASLNLLGKGVAVNHSFCVSSRAREGGPSASGFDPVAPARSYGDSSARADRNRWPRGWPWRVCALAFQAG